MPSPFEHGVHPGKNVFPESFMLRIVVALKNGKNCYMREKEPAGGAREDSTARRTRESGLTSDSMQAPVSGAAVGTPSKPAKEISTEQSRWNLQKAQLVSECSQRGIAR